MNQEKDDETPDDVDGDENNSPGQGNTSRIHNSHEHQ
jgi:hypothetical protein